MPTLEKYFRILKSINIEPAAWYSFWILFFPVLQPAKG
jgi:hypothetical protein